MREKIRLNLVMTYPVLWRANTIMNNFIQNFYDAVGADRFADGFHYTMDETRIEMSADTSFAWDWLLYLGTSTKRNVNLQTAGGFGEGFKVASLTAYRDYKMTICMESRDWRIYVTEEAGYIDGQEVKFLAYEVERREYQENSKLILGNVPEDFFEAFSEEMTNFYYTENPRFGKCIVSKEDYAVYEAAVTDKSDKYKGAVFSRYQLRAFIEPPVIICNHMDERREDDRDRRYFYDSEIRDCIIPVIDLLNEEEAMLVLKLFELFWGVNKKSEYNWEELIGNLIRKIMGNKEISKQFLNEYKDKLVTLPNIVYRSFCKSTVRMALRWYRSWGHRNDRKIVSYDFHSLGIEDIIDLCKKNGGFLTERDATEIERKYIRILEKASGTILKDLLYMEELPECKVLLNPKVPVDGYTEVIKKNGKTNCYNLRPVRFAYCIYIQSYVFEKDSFGRALAIYSHELLHRYGGDQSLQFRKALLIMNKKFMENADLLDDFEKEWRQVA